MTQLIRGERVAREGRVTLGCSATIFDAERRRILLTRRNDNGLWCLPGGRVEPGESVAEACAREVWEETGLEVRVGRLIGVYSDPHLLVHYADGHRCHIVALNFEAEPIDGTLRLSDETTAYGYFTPEEMESLPLMGHHRLRVADALAAQAAAFVR